MTPSQTGEAHSDLATRLLAHLRRSVGHLGLAFVREKRLRGALRVDHDALAAALTALGRGKHVRIISSLPYLVVRLLPWSGRGPWPTPAQQQISALGPRVHMEVPVSSSAAAAAKQSGENGGAGEGEELLDEVLEALGPDAGREQFRTILARHSPVHVRRCLSRTLATKAIRVSRAALFRSLLDRLAH